MSIDDALDISVHQISEVVDNRLFALDNTKAFEKVWYR